MAQHRGQFGPYALLWLETAQQVRPGAGRIGDHVAVTGFGGAGAWVQIGQPVHGQARQVGDVAAARADDGHPPGSGSRLVGRPRPGPSSSAAGQRTGRATGACRWAGACRRPFGHRPSKPYRELRLAQLQVAEDIDRSKLLARHRALPPRCHRWPTGHRRSTGTPRSPARRWACFHHGRPALPEPATAPAPDHQQQGQRVVPAPKDTSPVRALRARPWEARPPSLQRAAVDTASVQNVRYGGRSSAVAQ